MKVFALYCLLKIGAIICPITEILYFTYFTLSSHQKRQAQFVLEQELFLWVKNWMKY